MAEIAFLVVRSEAQIQGNGTKIMNQLKCNYVFESRRNAKTQDSVVDRLCRQFSIRIFQEAGIPTQKKKLKRVVG